jgi:NCS1 family nucleobase:cation symporter-1
MSPKPGISQRAQMGGQAVGLPFFMAAFSFMSIAITSCSVVIFGAGISDPIALLVGCVFCLV